MPFLGFPNGSISRPCVRSNLLQSFVSLSHKSLIYIFHPLFYFFVFTIYIYIYILTHAPPHRINRMERTTQSDTKALLARPATTTDPLSINKRGKQRKVNGKGGRRRKSSIVFSPFAIGCFGRTSEWGRAMATLSKLYSMREAAEHNTRDDCWVVIHGKVRSFYFSFSFFAHIVLALFCLIRPHQAILVHFVYARAGCYAGTWLILSVISDELCGRCFVYFDYMLLSNPSLDSDKNARSWIWRESYSK